MSEPGIVISHFQANPLLAHRTTIGAYIPASPDLGLSVVDVTIERAGVRFPGGVVLEWGTLEHIAATENACFRVDADGVEEIRIFSDVTNWVRSLMPTEGAPTMLVSGIPMHRIKGIDPHADTLRKIRTIAPLHGRVLDTATGLGYTAIEAAKTAEHVVTIELDPAGIAVARENPWSRDLFDNPRIEQIIGDTGEIVPTLPTGSFTRILHDPPAMSLAGDLYSGAFYRELRRILRPNGRLFHYIGDPESASGRNITRGVTRRLQAAGFSRVVRRPEAFGVIAMP